VAVNITHLDEDVEKGEILEEEGFGGSENEIEEKRFDSDDESGEMKSVGVQDESDKKNLVLKLPPSYNNYYYFLSFWNFGCYLQVELMLFGLLSLLMGHWIVFVAKICVNMC
jgi:hypothetical protein